MATAFDVPQWDDREAGDSRGKLKKKLSLLRGAAPVKHRRPPLASNWTSSAGIESLRDSDRPAGPGLQDPAAAIGELLSRCRSEIYDQEQQHAAAIWQLDYLLRPAREPLLPGVFFELVTGQRVQEVLADVCDLPMIHRKSLHLGPVPTAAAAAACLLADATLVESGVELRAVYADTGDLTPEQHRYLLTLLLLGADVRLAQAVPIDLLVLDDDVVILPVFPDRPGDALLVLHSAQWASVVSSLFDTCWAQAAPYTVMASQTNREVDAAPDQLTEQRLQTLRYLAHDLPGAPGAHINLSEASAPMALDGARF